MTSRVATIQRILNPRQRPNKPEILIEAIDLELGCEASALSINNTLNVPIYVAKQSMGAKCALTNYTSCLNRIVDD